jgi:hypothetical protein
MAVEAELRIGFASSGNSMGYLGGGWARAEADFTWAVGPESHLILPRLKEEGEYVLTLDIVPYLHGPELPTQRLVVSVNDTVIGTTTVGRPSLLGYRIAPGLIGKGDRVLVTLQHPDAARPVDFTDSADDRHLAFSITEAKLYRLSAPVASPSTILPPGLMIGGATERSFGSRSHMDLTEWVMTRTGMTLPQIAMKFESLGENCEFGLVQRRCDAEPLGLLRFSSTFLRNLIRGIDNGFEGLGEAEDIDPRLEGEGKREFMVHEKRYGLVYHTFVYEGQRSAWLMKEQEAARLKFLQRKFTEEVEIGEKIFVYKRNSEVTEEEVLPLFMALNRYGANTLLWIVPAERDRPSGTVEVAMSGLLKGYIDRFAPDDNAHDFSFTGWIKLCANAWLLSRLHKAEDSA